jgi:hypothetical protein
VEEEKKEEVPETEEQKVERLKGEINRDLEEIRKYTE